MEKKKVSGISVQKLSNGIRVVLEPLPFRKTVAFGVFVGVGSGSETKENNGVSHIIEHMLFKGTMLHTAKELADEMALLGDTVNAYTGKEYTAFYGITIAEECFRLMNLLAEMLFQSAFDQDALKKEKGVICEEIDLYNNSPDDYVHELLQMNVWKDHPLGFQISGKKGTVRKISREAILTFFHEHYVPENIVLSVSGSFEEEEVLHQINELFGTFSKEKKSSPADSARRLKESGLTPDSRYRKVFLEERGKKEAAQNDSTNVEPAFYHRSFCKAIRDTSQLHMNLAFPAISYLDERRHVATVFHSVFGGSNNSMLFQKIREEKGLSYSVYSYGCPYKREGLLQVEAVSAPSQAEEIFRLVLSCCAKLCENELSEETLRIHKSLIRTEAILSRESVLNRMEGNGRALLLRGRVVPQEEDLFEMEKVTASDIKNFSKDFLVPEKLSISLCGEMGTAAKGLQKWYNN